MISDEKAPDRGVREAIDLVFSKFAELQTVRNSRLGAQEQMPVPPLSREPFIAVEWKTPVYHTLHHR